MISQSSTSQTSLPEVTNATADADAQRHLTSNTAGVCGLTGDKQRGYELIGDFLIIEQYLFGVFSVL